MSSSRSNRRSNFSPPPGAGTDFGCLSRRGFLQRTLALAGATPWAAGLASSKLLSTLAAETVVAPSRSDAKVAIVPCRGYGAQVRPALDRCFDLLGGIGTLVKDKTVTVKINLTGTDFTPYLGRPVGETFMTHYDTAAALAAALFHEGARRVRFVESTQSRSELEKSLSFADWDMRALAALGKVEFENTRNLGFSKTYGNLKVPGGGYMFSEFEFNRSYTDTDVFISLAKLKNHVTAGVTLTIKNLFGITPNSRYGDETGSEEAVAGRLGIHSAPGSRERAYPGLKSGVEAHDPGWRIPRAIADICAARPVHLAIIDGITAMSGGEGPWCSDVAQLKPTSPGVIISGLNPVSTDAVGTAVMGYADPRGPRGTGPFKLCDNHLLLAEQAGTGIADLSRIDLRGLALEKARCPYG